MSVSKKLYKMQSSSFVEESTTVNNSTSKSVQSSEMSEHKEEVSTSAAGRTPMLGSSRIGKSGSLLDEMGFGSGGSMLKSSSKFDDLGFDDFGFDSKLDSKLDKMMLDSSSLLGSARSKLGSERDSMLSSRSSSMMESSSSSSMKSSSKSSSSSGVSSSVGAAPTSAPIRSAPTPQNSTAGREEPVTPPIRHEKIGDDIFDGLNREIENSKQDLRDAENIDSLVDEQKKKSAA